MNKNLQKIFSVVFLSVLLIHCKKKEFDDFYARPDSLEQPIYQVLQAKGQFAKLLSVIDKGGYKQTLSTAGYWTLFAPNDEAFDKYFKEIPVSGVEALDSVKAQAIIQYLLVYNSFNKERIDDYQSNIGWVPNSAFRRRTAFYTGFYTDTVERTGAVVNAIASNRNSTGVPGSSYVPADNNNKYIPYFTDVYFSAKGLTASDYTFFYPSTQFSGFNVADAKVLEKDIAAENGTIHIIDKVVAPLFSIDQYLRGKPQYSELKKLFDRYMVLFQQNPDASRRYTLLTGKSGDVFVKVYSNLLAFAPNSENWIKQQDNDAQRDSWTLFAPENTTLLNYINTVLLKYYKSLDDLPPAIISDFLNAHMFQSAVWPSKFASSINFLGENAADINTQTNVIDKKILSNGMFYGLNKVMEPNVFSTVYGKAYLDPQFSLMTTLLNMDLRANITGPSVKYTVFMMSDANLAKAGYSYDAGGNTWSVKPPAGTISTNDSNRTNLLRMLNTMVVLTPNGELDNFGTTGFSKTVETFGGEFIKLTGNQIQTAGTADRGLTVRIDSVATAKNGKVFYISDLLYFTYSGIGRHVEKLAAPATSEYKLFWQYLMNSSIYDAATGNITVTSGGTFYTLMVPNNNAIRKAITAGLLPGTSAVPEFNPTDNAKKELVSKFIQYHILNKRSVPPPGPAEEEAVETLLKTDLGDPNFLLIKNIAGKMRILDFRSQQNPLNSLYKPAYVVDAQSNQLSNRTLIHLIDDYLSYK